MQPDYTHTPVGGRRCPNFGRILEEQASADNGVLHAHTGRPRTWADRTDCPTAALSQGLHARSRIDLVDMSTCCDEIKQHVFMGRVTKLNFTAAVRPVREAQGNKLDSDPSNKSPTARRRNRDKTLSGAANAKRTSTMTKPISAVNAARVESKFNNMKREFSAQKYSRIQ
jgi:hypothetical protein